MGRLRGGEVSCCQFRSGFEMATRLVEAPFLQVEFREAATRLD